MRSRAERREIRREITYAKTDARVTDPVRKAEIAAWREAREAKRAANVAALPEWQPAAHNAGRRLSARAKALALTGLSIPQIADQLAVSVAEIERIAQRTPYIFSECTGSDYGYGYEYDD